MPIYGHRQFKPPMGVGINRAHGLAQSLRGFWPLNEGSGVPVDGVNGQSATSNTLVWSPGIAGRGPVLSNTAAAKSLQVSAPVGSPLDLTGAPGIAFGGWVYPTVSTGYQLICGRISGGTRQYAAFLSTSGTGAVFVNLGVKSGGGSIFSGDITVSPGWTVNAWNHVLATYDGANINVYINGIKQGSTAATGGIGSLALTWTFYAGYDGGAANFGLNGYLDVPGVWNQALSQQQIATLYRNPWQLFESPTPYWLLKSAAAGPSFQPWIYGDQIESNAQG